MSEVIASALIAAAASIVCQLIISNAKEKRDVEARAIRQQKLDDDIAHLTKRVDEHNNYASLFAEQTKALTGLSSDLKLIKQDIEYIKEGRFNINGQT